MQLSGRVVRMAPSATMSLDARAKSMKQRGEDVISLATGEPDFDTPEYVREAAVDALARGFTRYTPAAGVPELRNAISRKLKRDNGLDYPAGQIVVTTGAKQALHNALMVVCDEGDEVVIPAPYWVSYVEQVKLAGGTPVVVDCGQETGFKLRAEQLERAITRRTRGLILNSPCNPTGAVYDQDELADLARVIARAGMFVLTDEVYEHLVFDGSRHVSIAGLAPEMSELAIVVNALSKSHAMTGWRLGYAAGPAAVIAAMVDLQGHTTSHATSFVQQAAVAALDGPMEPISRMVAEFDRRRRLLVKLLNEIPGISCAMPGGAFYAFPDVSGWYGKTVSKSVIGSSADLAELLLTEAKIAVVPGEAFGAPGFLRFSYALATDRMVEAIGRMASLLSS